MLGRPLDTWVTVARLRRPRCHLSDVTVLPYVLAVT